MKTRKKYVSPDTNLTIVDLKLTATAIATMVIAHLI